ncbi:MAG: hypothetical protein ACI8RD_009648 [Bacillariaceae sp.]|jgi:hypothetical protein
MIGSRAWRALIRRDLIYRRRNIIGTIFELCLPIAFVGILVLIKGAVENTDSFSPEEIPANFPTNNDVLKIFSFTDYVTTLQADRKCINDDTGSDFPFPFRRRLQEEQAEALGVVMGSCSYNNQWSGESCMEFNGEGWTIDKMTERCSTESEGVFTEDEPCQISSSSESFAGWCIKDVTAVDDTNPSIEAMTMMITDISDCSGNQRACETFVGGDFDPSSNCVDKISSSTTTTTTTTTSEGGDEQQDGPPPAFGSGGLSITGIYSKGYNWQVPFVKCNSQFCRQDGQDAFPFCEFLALGVAPSTTNDTVGLQQAEAFQDYVNKRYPVLLDGTSMPFNFDFIQMFESNKQVEDYVTSKEYGDDIPKLALAIIFDGKTDPTINYNYAIRVNSTGFNSPEDEARPVTMTTPPTNKVFETYARADDESCPDTVGGAPDIGPYSSSCTGRYAYNGFLTIQRLIHDFIIDDSGAASNGYSVSENGVQFVSFPSESYIVNGKRL